MSLAALQSKKMLQNFIMPLPRLRYQFFKNGEIQAFHEQTSL